LALGTGPIRLAKDLLHFKYSGFIETLEAYDFTPEIKAKR